MIVYLVWEHYYNGFESWDSLESVHSTMEGAEIESVRLECLHMDSGSSEERSWYVTAREVKEE